MCARTHSHTHTHTHIRTPSLTPTSISLPAAGGVAVRIAAGVTTGGVAVLAAQPTDVVKVRLQAARPGAGEARYPGTLAAYRAIARHEGVAGLWKGASRNRLCESRVSANGPQTWKRKLII